MKLTIFSAILTGLFFSVLLGGIAWIQSDSQTAIYKGIVFFVTFGIIGWGLSFILAFFKPELFGKETINRERANVDYVFPDDDNE